MMESPLQRYFRDAMFQRVLSGTDEVQEMAIAWSLGLYLLKLPVIIDIIKSVIAKVLLTRHRDAT